MALRFLKPQASVWKPASLPLSLSCSGTEPFWSLETDEGALSFTEPDQPDRRLSLRTVMDRGIEGDPMRGMIAGDDLTVRISAAGDGEAKVAQLIAFGTALQLASGN